MVHIHRLNILSLSIGLLVMANPLRADNWTTGTAGQITSGSGSKVGVGKGTPAAQLEVENASANSREAFIVNQLHSSSAIARFRQNGSTKMLITNSGQIGIGTTSPASGTLLDVNGTAKATTLDAGTVRATALQGNGIFPIGILPNQAGNADNALSAALAAASPVGGTVYLAPGTYNLTVPVTIPAGVTLQGSWVGPHDGNMSRGTTLRLRPAGGNLGLSFFTMNSNSTIAGVTVYYPDQPLPTSTSNASVVKYGWTIAGAGDGTSTGIGASGVTVLDVTLVNSHLGIKMDTWHVRHFLRNVNMTALNTGVYLDRCTDIGRLENVHIHPNFWATMGGISEPQETVLNSHTKANLTAFKFGRVDWELLNGCFTIFSKIGFHFVRGGEVGASSHMDAGVEAINTGADDSIYPLWVEYSAVGQGLNFINGNFLGNTIIGPNNQGPVRFKNCVFFQANFPQDILIEKFGRGTLFLDGCWFSLWNQANKGRGALDIWEGTAHISNFEFQESEVNNDQIFHITALRVKGGKVNVTNGNFRGHGILNDGGSVNVSDVFMGPEMDKADNWTGIVNVSGSMNVTNANLSAPSALGNAWISRAGGVLNQVNVIP